MITLSMNVAEIFALVASLRGPRLRALIDAAQDVAVSTGSPSTSWTRCGCCIRRCWRDKGTPWPHGVLFLSFLQVVR